MQERLAYNPSFDRRDYQSLKFSDIGEKERLAFYIDRQLDTHLGERFNVLQSTITYDLKNGIIYGQDSQEPFIDVIKRGVVSEREQAELTGFEKIQKFFAQDAKDQDMMLSVSPPGGEYLHNFYDIFTLKETPKGKKLEMTRFSSALTLEEYQERLSLFKPFDNKSKDIDFLNDPIQINRQLFPTAEKMHSYLHRNHKFLTVRQFDSVKEVVASTKKMYIDFLSDERMHLVAYNALLNQADIVVDLILANDMQPAEKMLDYLSFCKLTKEKIYAWGMQPVRVIATPCGASGGFSLGGDGEALASPFRVYDKVLSSTSKAREWFNCPKCTYKADGPVGNKCPGCGLTKEQYADNGGKTC